MISSQSGSKPNMCLQTYTLLACILLTVYSYAGSILLWAFYILFVIVIALMSHLSSLNSSLAFREAD